jgi:hypothetical protein
MTMNMLKRLLSTMAMLTLAACGGGGGDAGNNTFGSGGTGGTGTSVTPTVTLQLTLLDQAGVATSNVLAGQPVRAQAVLRRNGTLVANEIVQFTADQGAALIRIDPTAGSQLTDANGTAVVTVSSLGTASGAGRITAGATVGGVSASSSANFFASASTTTQPPTLTLSALEIGSTAVSAYGTTGVRVRVLQGTTPYTAGIVTVNFTSSCPAGKATVTATTNTQPDGYATGTFVDNGCAPTADTTVTVTASIASDSRSGTMTVRTPTTGSLRFVSVVPSDKSITLRGQGGNGRQENATVTFQLVDVAGQGIADANVCFDSSTYIGGLNIDGFGPGSVLTNQGSTALCGSDTLSIVRYVKRTSADGTVTVQVNSGTVPTPVRIRARAIYPTTATVPLESFSDTLSVSTGLPLQRSFSLSVDKANIDGGNIDGETASLTVRLADQFSNPVPDGTVVNFISSGAAVCTANNGSCRTTNGACSCTLVSQARRPKDNRVVVLAYAVGLEDFDDRNGDNTFTAGVDPFTDLGDAYLDANKDGVANSLSINGDTDILIPYQNPNRFTATGDGSRGTAHIRASTIIYLSLSSSLGDSTVVFPLNQLWREFPLDGTAPVATFARLTPICPAGSPLPQVTVQGFLDDGIGNPMASGTAISVTDPSDNVTTGGFRPSSVLAIGARGPLAAIDGNNDVKGPWSSTNVQTLATQHSVAIKGVEDKCSGPGSFAVQVSSPRGTPKSARVLYEGEARTVERRALDVRYTNIAPAFTATPIGGSRVDVVGSTMYAPQGSAVVTGSSAVDCGSIGSNVGAATGSGTRFTCAYPSGATGNATIFYAVDYTLNGITQTVRSSVLVTVR